MADYTPYGADLYGNFIKGLQMGQNLKKDREEREAKRLTSQYAAEKNEMEKAKFEMDLGRMSGGNINTLEDYRLAQRLGVDPAQKANLLPYAGKNLPNPSVAPVPGMLPAQMQQFGALGSKAMPARTDKTPMDVSVPTTGPMRYGASEEEVQQFMQDQGNPNIERFREGLKQIGTNYSPAGKDEYGNLYYTTQKGAMKVVSKPKEEKSEYGFGYGQQLRPEDANTLARMLHAGQRPADDIMKRHSTSVTLAWNKLYPNESMNEYIARAKHATNQMTQRGIATIRSIIEPTRDEKGTIIEEGLLDKFMNVHKTLGMAEAGDWGPLTRLANSLNAKIQEESGHVGISTFNVLKNSLAAEISSALSAGGVPTDKRMEVELENLHADMTPAAFRSVMQRTKEVLDARLRAFESNVPYEEKVRRANEAADKIYAKAGKGKMPLSTGQPSNAMSAEDFANFGK